MGITEMMRVLGLLQADGIVTQHQVPILGAFETHWTIAPGMISVLDELLYPVGFSTSVESGA
jgi:hypothetical protein